MPAGARGDMSVSRGVGGMSCGMSRHSVSAACPQLVYCGNEPLPLRRAMQINMFCGSETQLLVMQGRGLNQPMGALRARCRPMAGRLVTMVSEQSVAKPNRLVTRCYTSGRATSVKSLPKSPTASSGFVLFPTVNPCLVSS